MSPATAERKPMDQDQALEKLDRTPPVITTPAEYRDAMKWWEGRFNVLTPFTNISGLAAQHGIIVSTVKINPDDSKTGAGEVYSGLPFLKPGEVALAKIGLRKLAECGAISTTTVRTDPRTIPHYWEFKAIASYRGIDGAIVTREATQEWDLRDGSDRLKGWTQAQISEGRKNGLRNCEARAINAAIREAGCGIKQKYSKEELARPFIVLRVAFQPDMSDPATKRQVTEAALRGTSLLYGGGAPALPAAVVDHDESDDEPRHVGRGSSAGMQTESTASSQPHPDEPPCEGAVRIVDVKVKAGETNGRKWTKYTVTDSNGEEYSTLDKSIGESAIKARDSKAWVELGVAVDGQYRNLEEIAPAGQQPSLPDLENT